MPSNNTPSNISGNVFGIESNQLKRTVKGLNDSFTYTKNISDNIRNISDDTENLYNNSKKLYNNSDIDIKQDRAFYKAQLQWNAESKNLLREIKNTIIASSTKDEANIEKSFNKFKKQLEDDNKKDLESNEKVLKELESIGLNIKENEKKEEKRHKNEKASRKKINESITEGFNAFQEANRKNIQQIQEIYQILDSQNKLLSKATKDMNHHYLLRGTWTEKLYNGVIGIKREITDNIKDVKGFFKAGGNVALLAIEKGIEKLIDVVKGIGDEIVKRTEEQLNILRERSAQTAKDYQMDYNTARLLESSNMKFFSRMNESLGAGASAYAEKTAADIFNRFTSKRQMMSREKQVMYQEGLLIGDADLLMNSGMFKTRDAAKKFASVSKEISAQLTLATKLANEQGMNNSLNYIHEMIDSAGGNPDKLMEISPAILNEIDMLKRMSHADKATREAYDQKKSLSQTLAEIKDNDAYSGMTEEQKYKLVAKRTAEYALTSSRLSGPGKSIIEAFYDANAEMLRSRMPELATKPEYISQLKTFGGDELYKAFREGDVEKALNIIRKNSLTKDLSGFSTVLNEITGMSMDAGTWKGGLKQINDQFENVQTAISEFNKIDLAKVDKNIMGTASRLEELTASDKSLDTMIVGEVEKLDEIAKKYREDNKVISELEKKIREENKEISESELDKKVQLELDKKIKNEYLQAIQADQKLVNNIKKFGFMDEKGNLNEDQFYTRVKFNSISKNFTEIGEKVPTSFSGAMDTLFRLATKATMNPNWKTELDKISSSMKPLFEIFGEILAKDVFPKLADPLQKVIEGALSGFFGIANTIFENLPAFVKGIVDAFSGAAKGAGNAITDEFKDINEKFEKFKNNLNEFILDPLKQFWDDKVIPFWNDKVEPTLDKLIDRVIMNIPLIGGDAAERVNARSLFSNAGISLSDELIRKMDQFQFNDKEDKYSDDFKNAVDKMKNFKDILSKNAHYFKDFEEYYTLSEYLSSHVKKNKTEKDIAAIELYNAMEDAGIAAFTKMYWGGYNKVIFDEAVKKSIEEANAKKEKTIPEQASGGLFKRVEGGRIIKIAEGDGDEIVLPLSRTQRDNAMNLLQIAKDKYGLPIEILGDKNKGIDINRENLRSYINTQLNYVSDREAIKAYKEAKQILKNSIITLGQGLNDSTSIVSPSSNLPTEDWNENNPSLRGQHTIGDLMLAYAKLQLGRPYWIRAYDTPMKNGEVYKDGFVCNELVKSAARAAGLKDDKDFPDSGAVRMYSDSLTNKSNVSPGKGVIAWGNKNQHIGIMVSPTHWINASGSAKKGTYNAKDFAYGVSSNSCGVLINKIPTGVNFGIWSKLNEIATTENYKQFFKATGHNVNEKDFDISDVKHFNDWPRKRNKSVQETYHTNYPIPYLDDNLKPLYNIDTSKYPPPTEEEQLSGNPPKLETIPNIDSAKNQEILTQSFSKIQEGYERIKTIMSPSNTNSRTAKSKETLQVIKEISSQIGEIAKYAYSMAKQPVQSKVVNYSSFGTNNHYVNTEAYR